MKPRLSIKDIACVVLGVLFLLAMATVIFGALIIALAVGSVSAVILGVVAAVGFTFAKIDFPILGTPRPAAPDTQK